MQKKIIVTAGMSCLLALATGWAAPGDNNMNHDRMQQQDRMDQQDRMQQQDMMQDRDQMRDHDQMRNQDQMRDHNQVFGWQMMTEKERTEFQTRMRSLKTQQEIEAFRLEHHKKMQARAKERGITLPDMP